jgi:hypothetical protein
VRYQGIHDKWELTRIDASKELQKLSNRASVEVARQKAAVTSRSDEAARILESSLPRAKRDIMPTRLGNVFRRFEREAGRQYSLDAPYFFPHLMLLAPSDHVAYVNDQRSQFDLAIRMSLTGLHASMIAIIFLWWHGLWLLIALVPYALAYLSYRGAIVLARQYATAVNTVVDVNRL